MSKTILITGSTDGIGQLTAKKLAAEGHTVLLHGRSAEKLSKAERQIEGNTETYVADLTSELDVAGLAEAILAKHERLDVLINNAGVLRMAAPILDSGLDARFVVNTFAPYILTLRLLSIIPKDGRVVNLSSAAQAPVDTQAMLGNRQLDHMGAYAQSKLAITIWTREMAKEMPDGPQLIAVNPGSLLASNMVKGGFGVEGNDLSIGADILCEAALGARFANASGLYFDNDSGQFNEPHAAALDADHSAAVMLAIRKYVSEYL
ncbi:SDR family NAD(P)-dependent oxidoreductase [Ruegeria lacuscaerulensis]|uniref:SDR family NAD(P)-dependent oxidoreductase n=1 Tax=Ruegeria lacuscaerulensis TaxID=55218 RepID=UPI00147B4FC1|nr:SDR family NAD(P)-dependent oxidoreductase [Ruegeria lacuscaerulensis]